MSNTGLKAKYWIGQAPDRCDFCLERITVEFIDGATRNSSHWANMCPTCHPVHGKGLGPGRGQRYVRQEDMRYVMVEG